MSILSEVILTQFISWVMMIDVAFWLFRTLSIISLISIEVAGKQATAAEIEEVIKHAIEEEIKIIFYQEEFDDNQAQTIAEEIGGKVVKISPLSENYLQAMRDFIYALDHQED